MGGKADKVGTAEGLDCGRPGLRKAWTAEGLRGGRPERRKAWTAEGLNCGNYGGLLVAVLHEDVQDGADDADDEAADEGGPEAADVELQAQ
jgi:hypothetical protein